MSERPNLILTLAGVSARSQFIEENRDYIESLPIDGIVVNIPATFNLMSPGVRLRQADLDAWLPRLSEFNVGKQNYLLVHMDRPGDLFDDGAWSRVLDNWQLLAGSAKDAGFQGIIFDNEEYKGVWDNFPEDYPGASAEDLEMYQAQSSLRGNQVMDAIESAFPDSAVGVMHGPYASLSNGENQPDAITSQLGGPQGQELRGPFFTGMLEAKGEAQNLIDMGELYQLRTGEEFRESQDYRSNVVPDLIDWEVEQDLLDAWDENVVISHMVATDAFPLGYSQTPESLTQSLVNAFNNSEEMVFLYSDWREFDWLTLGAVDQVWINAVSRAIEIYEAQDTGAGTELPHPATCLPLVLPTPLPPPCARRARLKPDTWHRSGCCVPGHF